MLSFPRKAPSTRWGLKNAKSGIAAGESSRLGHTETETHVDQEGSVVPSLADFDYILRGCPPVRFT
ncbi:protein of unknown function [Hyphomicrobium sp. MC1]|nr:protein of unknown function [Hyphomicrobium sp. MC1]